jgi:hypothetical protein
VNLLDRCPDCGATDLSFVDARFGHCQRGAGRHVRGHDTVVEGYHPGLGHVTGSIDLAKKIEAAKRAGKTVQFAKDLPSVPSTGGVTKTNPGPSAWEKTMQQMRGA